MIRMLIDTRSYRLDAAAQGRLEDYLGGIGEILGSDGRRASFATYAMGLLGDGERKSIEPIAARSCPDPAQVDAAHQRLLHFVSNSPWSDELVRLYAARYGLEAMTRREPVQAWIFDDTGFLKQGTHSVGVKRQYTGSAGKVTNCQVAVSLTVGTATQHLPIDFQLYLPHEWADDPARRAEGRIPDDVQFQTKPQIAINMMRWAVAAGVAPGVVLADSQYGHSSDFRQACRDLGLHYAVEVMVSDRAWRMDKLGRRIGVPEAVQHFALPLMEGGFRRTTWREGSRKKLSSRFAMQRVQIAQGNGEDREEVWLLMEWEDGESLPNRFYVSSLPPSTSRKTLVRVIKQRWRTERVYEDLKGELGLDHFEGRRFPGWHHHVTIALACFAFIAAERAIAFPPSGGDAGGDRAQRSSTRAALSRLFHHGTARRCACAGHVAPALPAMPPPA